MTCITNAPVRMRIIIHDENTFNLDRLVINVITFSSFLGQIMSGSYILLMWPDKEHGTPNNLPWER